MSKVYENEIANEIHRNTPTAIRSYRCGYSGSLAIPQPDLLVTAPDMLHAMELKGPIQLDRLYIDAEDIEQLVECENHQTAVYLVVKFQRRAPMVVRYYGDMTNADEEWTDMTPTERLAVLVPDAFDPHVTDNDNLRIDKPTLDEWDSGYGEDDYEQILHGVGIGA